VKQFYGTPEGVPLQDEEWDSALSFTAHNEGAPIQERRVASTTLGASFQD
jgi:hypothetical protein